MDNVIKNHVLVWGAVFDYLSKALPSHAIKTWFVPIAPLSYEGGVLSLLVPSQFFLEWIQSHYKKNLINSLQKVVKDERATYNLVVEKKPQTIEFEHIQKTHKKERRFSPNINKNYCFKNFIEGSNNEFAKNASLSVSSKPGKSNFNPLIIYGGVGLGKTHLLHSIGNYVFETDPLKNVILVTSEKFTLDFVNSLRKNNTDEFTRLYRSADILLIDDVQFFRGKEQTQEQFFHTFNELYQSGRQIVMTSDVLPSEMKGLQDRLVSRFQSGLSVDIQPPNYEIRIAILLEKSEQNGINLEYGYLEFIARHIKSNIRDLEGTIIRILAKSSLMNKEIDFDLIKEVVKERVGSSFLSELSIESVVKKASELTRVKEKDLVGKSRKAEIALARQLSMYLCRDVLGASLNKIGLFFGGRDHSTVIHALKVVEDKKQKDDNFCKKVEFIKRSFETLV